MNSCLSTDPAPLASAMTWALMSPLTAQAWPLCPSDQPHDQLSVTCGLCPVSISSSPCPRLRRSRPRPACSSSSARLGRWSRHPLPPASHRVRRVSSKSLCPAGFSFSAVTAWVQALLPSASASQAPEVMIPVALPHRCQRVFLQVRPTHVRPLLTDASAAPTASRKKPNPKRSNSLALPVALEVCLCRPSCSHPCHPDSRPPLGVCLPHALAWLTLLHSPISPHTCPGRKAPWTPPHPSAGPGW